MWSVRHTLTPSPIIWIPLMSWLVLGSRSDNAMLSGSDVEQITTSILGLKLAIPETQLPSHTLSVLVVTSVTGSSSSQHECTRSRTGVPRPSLSMPANVNNTNITVTSPTTTGLRARSNISDSTPDFVPSPPHKGWGFASTRAGWAPCISGYNNLLGNSTEVDKWASGVATTLMALLPSLLAFGPLRTADAQTLYYLDGVVALLACGFTLLFRLDTWTTLPRDKIWRATDILNKRDIDAISCYWQENSIPGQNRVAHPPSRSANTVDPDVQVITDRPSTTPPPAVNIDLPRLQGFYESGKLNELQQEAVGISPDILHGHKKRRPNRITVYMVITLLFLFQLFLFLVITAFVFHIVSPIFIWACGLPGVFVMNWWIVGSFLLAAMIRYTHTSLWVRADEIFHIQKVSAFTSCSCYHASALSSNPIPERSPYCSWRSFRLRCLWKDFTQFEVPTPKRLPELFQITCKVLSTEWTRLKEPHPMVLVIRPSIDALHGGIVWPWLASYIQVIYLGSVTFLFGSLVFGSLFNSLAFVATFLSAVAFSRLASVWLCARLEKWLGLTIIEYCTEEEWVAIWLIINTMPDCLVESMNSSYRYANGYRPHLCPEAEWGTTTIAGTNLRRKVWGNIPMPDINMLKTSTQIPNVKTICTVFSVAFGFVLALSTGAISGILWSYILSGPYLDDILLFGGIFAGLAFIFLVWRLSTEFESAAGYDQALQWARVCNAADGALPLVPV